MEHTQPPRPNQLETLSGPELLDWMEGRFFIRNHDGITFVDLLTKEPLEAGMPVPGVEYCPLVRDGLDHLRTLGSRGNVTVDLVLAKHGSAKHFADTVEQHGDALLAASAVAIEANWAEREVSSATPTLAQYGHSFVRPWRQEAVSGESNRVAQGA